MKKKNIILIIIGLLMISLALYLFFVNSKTEIDVETMSSNINSLKEEIMAIEVTDKVESYKEYQVKISELGIKISELEGKIYEAYKEKNISLFDYLKYENKVKKYNQETSDLKDYLAKKINNE